MRNRYAPVRTRHVEGLCGDGRRDDQAGQCQTPQGARRINTARGSVESWLPTNVSQLFYQCGQDFATQGPAQWASVRQTLDAAVRELFSKARPEARSSLSATLIGPAPDAGDAAAPSPPAAAPPSPPPLPARAVPPPRRPPGCGPSAHDRPTEGA